MKSPKNTSTDCTFADKIAPLVKLAMLLVVLFLLYFTFTRKIYQFDSYTYLYNGYILVTEKFEPTYISRNQAPLIAFFFAPFFWFFSFLPTFQTVHIISFFSLFITFLMLFLSYRFFKNFFQPSLSLVLVFLLLTNRLVLHYASEPMVDIFPLIWILMGYLCYYRSLEMPSNRYILLAGLFLGLAFASRQISSVFSMGLFLSYCFRYIFDREFKLRKRFSGFLSGLFCLSLFPMVIGLFFYSLLYYCFTLQLQPLIFFAQFRGHSIVTDRYRLNPTDQPYENIYYLIASGGIVFFLLFFLGFALTLYRWKKKPEILFPFLICMSYLSLVTPHHEGRYILPLLPFAYYFMGRGWLYLSQIFSKFPEHKSLIWAGWCFIFLSAGYIASLEMFTLSAPFYREPFLQRVSRKIATLGAKEENIYFLRRFYGLYPKSYPAFYHFTPLDEFYHFYHLYSYPFQMFSGCKIQDLGIPIEKTFFPTQDSFFLRDCLGKIKASSILIYGHMEEEYSLQTSDYSIPLAIGKIGTESLKAFSGGFRSEHFEIRKGPSGVVVKKGLFPFDLYGFREGKRVYIGCITDPHHLFLENRLEEIPLTLEIWEALGLSPSSPLLVAYQKTWKFYRDSPGR